MAEIHVGKFINNLDTEDLTSEKLQGVVNNVYAKAIKDHKKTAKKADDNLKQADEDTVEFEKSNHDRLKANKDKIAKDLNKDDAKEVKPEGKVAKGVEETKDSAVVESKKLKEARADAPDYYDVTDEDIAMELADQYYNHEIDLPRLHGSLKRLFGSTKKAVEWFADYDHARKVVRKRAGKPVEEAKELNAKKPFRKEVNEATDNRPFPSKKDYINAFTEIYGCTKAWAEKQWKMAQAENDAKFANAVVDVWKRGAKDSFYNESKKVNEAKPISKNLTPTAKELEDELDNKTFVSFCYVKSPNTIFVRGAWKKSGRSANGSYVDLKVFLNKRLGDNNFNIKVLGEVSRDGGREYAYEMDVILKYIDGNSVNEGRPVDPLHRYSRDIEGNEYINLDDLRASDPEGFKEDIWKAVCAGDGPRVNQIFADGYIQPNEFRYDKFGKKHSLIMGALRNGEFETAELLKSYGEKILKSEVDEYKSIMARKTYTDETSEGAVDESKNLKEKRKSKKELEDESLDFEYTVRDAQGDVIGGFSTKREAIKCAKDNSDAKWVEYEEFDKETGEPFYSEVIWGEIGESKKVNEASYRGLAYYEYKGCHVRETPSCFVATDEHGTTLGQSQTKYGAEGIIDDYVKARKADIKEDVNDFDELKQEWQEFLELGHNNVIEFEDGDYLYFDIDFDKHIMFAGSATNTGVLRQYEIYLDPSLNLDENIAELYDEIVWDKERNKIESFGKQKLGTLTNGHELFIDTSYGSGYQLCAEDGFGNYNPWTEMGHNNVLKVIEFDSPEDVVEFAKLHYGDKLILEDEFITESKKLKEDWTVFEFTSGSNPYIAKTEKEVKRLLRKYKGKVDWDEYNGNYIVDDKENYGWDKPMVDHDPLPWGPSESLVKEDTDIEFNPKDRAEAALMELSQKLRKLSSRRANLQKEYDRHFVDNSKMNKVADEASFMNATIQNIFDKYFSESLLGEDANLDKAKEDSKRTAEKVSKEAKEFGDDLKKKADKVLALLKSGKITAEEASQKIKKLADEVDTFKDTILKKYFTESKKLTESQTQELEKIFKELDADYGIDVDAKLSEYTNGDYDLWVKTMFSEKGWKKFEKWLNKQGIFDKSTHFAISKAENWPLGTGDYWESGTERFTTVEDAKKFADKKFKSAAVVKIEDDRNHFGTASGEAVRFKGTWMTERDFFKLRDSGKA